MERKPQKKLSVSIDYRQWLRGRLSSKSWLLNFQIVQRYLRIGQGPHEFINKLIKEQVDGIIYKPFNFQGNIRLDVLGKIKPKRKQNKKMVVRLDGIGTDKFNICLKKSYQIKEYFRQTIDNADGIIFQSKFCENAYRKVYGKINIPTTVIYNGFTNDREVKNISRTKKKFVVGGRNSPRKRINDVIDCFEKSSISNHYILDVVGDPIVKRIESKNINYRGRLSHEALLECLSNSIGLIHLDWYDWCPNLVLDSISVGTPVLCGKVGGTPEVVGRSGFICDMNDPEPVFDKAINKIPSINFDIFDKCIKNFIDYKFDKKDFLRKDLCIKNVAAKYAEFLKKINDKNKI